MKYLHNLHHKAVIGILLFCIAIATLLHITNIHFPCINSDEASFAYNAYSILKTGKDEYGITLPLRFKAFGENKLPVTIYSIVPSLAIFGMSDVSSRLPFILLGILSPLLFYTLSKELFGNKYIALIAAFLSAISPWIQILSRHIHEATIIMHLGGLSLLILARLMKKISLKYIIYLSLLNGIALFTYHIAKIFTVFYFVWLMGILIYHARKQKMIILKGALIFIFPILIFLSSELLNPTNRVSNLLFTNNIGFTLTIDELRKENPNRLLHNKITHAVKVFTKNYLVYFSPDFLTITGDANERFGYPGMYPMSAVEYIFIFIGLYYLFARKEQFRYIILTALLFAPISAALTWQEQSLTRSFFMIVPIILTTSYGMYHFVLAQHKRLQIPAAIVIGAGVLFFILFSWEYYFYHYPKKTEAIYGWQCGYKELSQYIQTNYQEVDTFYITKKLGQPYIFALFFNSYPPEKYQKQAQLSKIGEYGFGEVERYDKFEFNFTTPKDNTNNVYVGYPEDFQGTNIPEKNIQKIKIYNDEVFWIYKSQPYTNK